MKILEYFLFIILPYIALASFIFGTIYRYRYQKFSISSLSSEFLEGKKLFWGSQPFHWGISFLFFGHLTAFLIPRSVLAWNGHPVRLLILEITGFSFGLAFLFGLTLLIYRRFSNSRIRTVTSKVDVLVYALLLLQVVTGLYIAYFFRWGSSWFAAVLTPYLGSIFKLSPNITAVSAMSWWIKLHIAGAFTLVLIIPFTRLMHILLPPLAYIWRPYQKVMWYWDRRTIRDPDFINKKHVRPRNN